MYLKAQWIQAAGALALLLAAPAAIAAEVTVDLVTKRERLEVSPGRYDTVITLNSSLPGPILRFREGDTVTVNLKNQLPEMTAIHWHGLLIPGHHDGAPGFNGFNGVQAGETYQYKFTLRQSGTYWYHSHASTQEQAGQYGALIIDPKDGPDVAVDREHVILLTDHTPENPERIARNLKADPGYYNWNKRTFTELLRDASKFGLGKTLADRAEWGRMRMDVTDIADVGNYTLLANGLPTVRKPFFEVKKGEKVRLRFINGSAMSFMDVRIPGLTMTVIAADGRMVEPVKVDEFRMGVAETYDVLVEPTEDRAWPLWVETIDRRANLLAVLGPRADMTVEAPGSRPRQVLMLGEMGHGMAMDGVSPDPHAGHTMAIPDSDTEILNAAAARQPNAVPDLSGMRMAQAGPACTPEHAAMGHCTLTPGSQRTGERIGSAVPAAPVPGGTPFPRVDYGYGADPMAGMDHSKMDHGAELGREGDTDGSGRVFGWASGAPYGARVLSIRDLVAAAPGKDSRAPTRDIVIRITGNMERYMWSLNGKPFGEAPPVDVQLGERVRITFVNETMMAHPMHLHGMFFEVENGSPADRMPEKNVIAVAPGRTQSVILTANEPGEWPLHCHLLFHMDSGMMKKLVVANVVSAAVGASGADHAHPGH